jgi:hypothetical protein
MRQQMRCSIYPAYMSEQGRQKQRQQQQQQQQQQQYKV